MHLMGSSLQAILASRLGSELVSSPAEGVTGGSVWTEDRLRLRCAGDAHFREDAFCCPRAGVPDIGGGACSHVTAGTPNSLWVSQVSVHVTAKHWFLFVPSFQDCVINRLCRQK